MKSGVEFLITVSPNFPNEPSFLKMAQNVLDDMEAYLKSHSNKSKGEIDHFSNLLNISSKHFQDYAKEGGAPEVYGKERGSLRPLITRLDHPRYIDHYDKLVQSDLKDVNSEMALEIPVMHKFSNNRSKTTNIHVAKPLGSSDFALSYDTKFNLELNFLEGSTAILVHSPRENGYGMYKEPEDIEGFARRVDFKNETNILVDNIITSKPDFEKNVTDMTNCHRVVTQSCDFHSGGSTHANLALLALANHTKIELPMPKLGETLWLSASLLHQETYLRKFKLGVEIKNGVISKTEVTQNMLDETMFDPYLTKKDIFDALKEIHGKPQSLIDKVKKVSPTNESLGFSPPK